MAVAVGARVPGIAIKHAAMGLGLSPHAPRAAVIRAALALFHGLDPADYLDLPASKRANGVGKVSNDLVNVSAYAHDEIAAMPEGVERSTAIRTGLALANEWSREEAEEWAQVRRGRPAGSKDSRPRKRRTRAELAEAAPAS